MYEGVSRSPCKITELSCFFDDAKVGKKQKHRPYHVVRVVLSFFACGIKFFTLWYYLCNFCGIICAHILRKRVHFILNIKIDALLEL